MGSLLNGRDSFEDLMLSKHLDPTRKASGKRVRLVRCASARQQRIINNRQKTKPQREQTREDVIVLLFVSFFGTRGQIQPCTGDARVSTQLKSDSLETPVRLKV